MDVQQYGPTVIHGIWGICVDGNYYVDGTTQIMVMCFIYNLSSIDVMCS